MDSVTLTQELAVDTLSHSHPSSLGRAQEKNFL